MKKLFALSLISALTLGACSIESTLDDIGNDLQQQLDDAQKQELAKAAAPLLAAQIGKAVGSAAAETDATMAPFHPLLDIINESITLNETVEIDGGGSVTVEGTVTMLVTGDDVTAPTDWAATQDLTVTWTDVTLSVQGQSLASSGSETITADFAGSVSDTTTYAGTVVLAGSFTLGEDEHEFDMTITADANGASYTGTVNGEEISGTIDYETPEGYSQPETEVTF